jgi:hypothetical protein
MKDIFFLIALLFVYIGLGCEKPDTSMVDKIDLPDSKVKVLSNLKEKESSKEEHLDSLSHQEIIALLETHSFYEPAYNICFPKDKECRMKDFFVKRTFEHFDENTTSINYTSEFIYSENVLLLNKLQEAKLKDDKLFYKGSKGYFKINIESADYILCKFYDSDGNRKQRLDKRVYFELDKAEKYYEFLKQGVEKDFKTLMAGKTFYYLQEGKFLIELSFDKEFISSTGIVIAGDGLGDKGTANFTTQGKKFIYENGGYMELIEMSEDYLSFSLYTDENPDDSIFIKMFFDKSKAEEYFNFFSKL